VAHQSDAWWRGAAIFQVYLRSFADGNGDGVGDLAGLRSHLQYIAGLGVDAIWLTPWYPSPMADGGYDVADYRAIDPVFGTLAEAEKFIEEAHGLGIRVITDVVPNHCSDQHRWFQQALATGPGSAERELFWFRPGRGDRGELPPTDLASIFGGSAWTRVPDGEWYLHLFAPEQPDFNWNHPRVREEFEDVLRFWLDRGVDGIRIDSAAVLIKDPMVNDAYEDQDGIHEIYQGWRRVAETYGGDRALIGEVWLPDHEAFARYLRPDEMHTAFNFAYLQCSWDAGALRECIDLTLAVHAPVRAPATWVLSNHDVTRPVTRYGRTDTTFDFAEKRRDVPTDLALGARRARAGSLLTLALPGAAYIYQGEELGLEEVEDLDDAVREDPMFYRSGGRDPGRDGCRVPIPWTGDAPPFGFSPDDATAAPWLPQPVHWHTMSVAAQTGDRSSTLELYRAALRLHRTEPGLGDGTMTWLDAPPGVLAFRRAGGFACVANLSAVAVALPDHEEVLLSSAPLEDGCLPSDAAAWLRLV
jgi:alpha-glucosidase